VTPADYHDFFLGSVTMGGALVGLLFVAVSVNPGGIREQGALAKRVQATSALSAFLSPLFISLVALLPGSSPIGPTAVALGIGGAFTMLSLLLLTLRRHHGASIWARISMTVLIAGQLVAYVIQIILGAELIGKPAAAGPLSTLTTLLIIFFAFGVTRTWEYVDGLPLGQWGAVSQATRSLVRKADAAPDAQDGPPEDADGQRGEQ
jgi:hypothetical protein